MSSEDLHSKKSAPHYPCITVVGPTASGKSELAQYLACSLNGAVLSADSMQIYTGMDIGTGKVPLDKRSCDYYGLDIVDPGTPYSAALFQTYGRGVIEDLAARNKPCIMCGGTGLYIRAVIDDYRFPSGDQINNEIRDNYQALLDDIGAQALWDKLNAQDPASAQLIHPNNTKRVIRAFELLEQGKSYAQTHEGFKTMAQVIDACFIGIEVAPEVLLQRIDKRVDTMIDDGLVDEVQLLLDKGFRFAITANQAIGYKEIVRALDGEISLDQAVEDIKTASHRYAKRQRTWFRKDKRIHWFSADYSDIPAFHESVRNSLATILETNTL